MHCSLSRLLFPSVFQFLSSGDPATPSHSWLSHTWACWVFSSHRARSEALGQCTVRALETHWKSVRWIARKLSGGGEGVLQGLDCFGTPSRLLFPLAKRKGEEQGPGRRDILGSRSGRHTSFSSMKGGRITLALSALRWGLVTRSTSEKRNR